MTVEPAPCPSGVEYPPPDPATIRPQPSPGSAEPSDESLLDRVAERDLAALDLLYTRHGRTAFSIAYGILGTADAAEDVVQDAFLTIWRRAASFDVRRGNARTWLLTVVRHRAIDVVRSRAARPRGVPLEDAGAIAADDGDPSSEALRRIEAVTVRSALGGLPSLQRQVVELAFFSGLSYPEIAEQVGVPLGTVKSRIRLALERLRGTLLPLMPAAG